MWKWIKTWWENKKGVIVDFILPVLDKAKTPLAVKLAELEGTPEQQADKIIEWIKEYIKRQL